MVLFYLSTVTSTANLPILTVILIAIYGIDVAERVTGENLT
jgi:hypothetical protein